MTYYSYLCTNFLKNPFRADTEQHNRRLEVMRTRVLAKTAFQDQMREIMNLAWHICRITCEPFSVCLHKAWMNFKLKVAMMTKVVRFSYIKKSTGELRTALGTTDPHKYDYTPTGGVRNGNFADCVQYYDKEADGFRMFKSYNLVTISL